MKRVIKFRRPHYHYSGLFHSFSEWGPVEYGFKSPASISGKTNMQDEQYTGLKDGNGVEVYEGDVIMFTYKTGGGCFSRQGKVIFEQYMFLVEIENGDYFSLNRIGGVNIIGNIHENPELL